MKMFRDNGNRASRRTTRGHYDVVSVYDLTCATWGFFACQVLGIGDAACHYIHRGNIDVSERTLGMLCGIPLGFYDVGHVAHRNATFFRELANQFSREVKVDIPPSRSG
jgi:hypothetical protein